jgi:signal transduction histidine kinase
MNAGGQAQVQTRVVSPRLLDGCLALALAAAGGASGLSTRSLGGHDPYLAVGVLTAMGLVLYPRRRFPALVLAAEAAGVGVLVALRVKMDASFLSVLVSSYSAAVYGSRRLARVLLAAAAAVVLAVGIPGVSGHGTTAAPVPTLLAAAGAWGVGLVIRRQFALRDAAVAALAERASAVAERETEQARRATLAERLRIARELHDIVAHHLSVVVIQAQGAQRVMSSDTGRAREAMAEVERTGRTALEEMRRLLGLLRTGDADPDAGPGAGPGAGPCAGPDAAEAGEHVPAAGVADLDELAERTRRAGLPVTISVNGVAGQVPPDVGLTVYRVVQEALTNTLKHAGPGTSSSVSVARADGWLDVLVTDDGRGAAAVPAAPGGGRGTTGMRERVLALGGSLTIGPRTGGGFGVHARIPV